MFSVGKRVSSFKLGKKNIILISSYEQQGIHNPEEKVFTLQTLAASSFNWPVQRHEQSLNTSDHLLRQCFCSPPAFKLPPDLASTDLPHHLLGFRACSPRQHYTKDISLKQHPAPLAHTLLCPEAAFYPRCCFSGL